MNLFMSYNLDVDQAYIIRILGNEVSERFAQRCAESCVKVDMPYSFWDAYDGVDKEIKAAPQCSYGFSSHHRSLFNTR
jgi:hypothetical protein